MINVVVQVISLQITNDFIQNVAFDHPELRSELLVEAHLYQVVAVASDLAHGCHLYAKVFF